MGKVRCPWCESQLVIPPNHTMQPGDRVLCCECRGWSEVNATLELIEIIAAPLNFEQTAWDVKALLIEHSNK